MGMGKKSKIIHLSHNNFDLKISGKFKDWENFREVYYSYLPAQKSQNALKLYKDIYALTSSVISDELNKKSRSYSKAAFKSSIQIFSALFYEIIKYFKKNDLGKYRVLLRELPDDTDDSRTPIVLTHYSIKSLFDKSLKYYARDNSFPKDYESFEKHYLTAGRKLINTNIPAVEKIFSMIKCDFYNIKQKSRIYDLASDIVLSLSYYRSKINPDIVCKEAIGKEKYLDDLRFILLSAFPSLKQITS